MATGWGWISKGGASSSPQSPGQEQYGHRPAWLPLSKSSECPQSVPTQSQCSPPSLCRSPGAWLWLFQPLSQLRWGPPGSVTRGAAPAQAAAVRGLPAPLRLRSPTGSSPCPRLCGLQAAFLLLFSVNLSVV
uniref:Uncharacterized protein n=1 Tax=Molossus molossus TaxID=27622 RepID=A0A7J8ERP4_MOLMO|nr:hypothetical protein HJG59_008734 [Molossus molossus]